MSGAMQAIVGFEIRVSRIEGTWKLSQNRSATDRRGVAQGLHGDIASLIPVE